MDDYAGQQEQQQQDLHEMEEEEMEFLELEREDDLFDDESSSSTTNATMTPEDLDMMHQEREAIFEFSDQEKQAWSQPQMKLSPQLMMEIAEARAALERERSRSETTTTVVSKEEEELHHPSFSHVSQDGDSVHMVDVGHKQVTTRMAEAQTKVILPDSVMEAFGLDHATSSSSQTKELIGPKGPILATAKLAGIMAAKKNK
mmetsp:Transcript_23733/g.58173  ORF Transcript_23733/g.58173 Transcript_23733/m.58173 type:complete len:202 (+) Transcript_23733:160-765(+)